MNTTRKFSIFNFQLLILLLLAAIVTACNSKSSQSEKDETKTASSAESKANTPGEVKKLPFEHGTYVETSNMMGIELKKTTYFDHWGDWTAAVETSEMQLMGSTHKTEKLNITKGNSHWDIDPAEKTGTHYESYVPSTGVAAALGAAIGGKLAEGTELKDLGEENYLGYACKKIYVKYTKMDMEATMLSYGNLTMKMDGRYGKMNISSQVISIDLSAPPASIFEVPADVTIENQ